MKQVVAGIMVGTLLLSSLPAVADEHRGGERERHWDGREIHRFAEHDFELWRGGRWYHGRHEGRRGWWWITAGVWYFYPAPVYPYPDPYTPPVMVVNPQAPVMVAPQAAVPAQPPGQTWYYCDSSQSYYPYVSSCPEGWKSVPAQPSAVAAPQAPAPAPAPAQQPTQFWNYCESAKAYFPNVPSCPEGWKSVPAQPAPR